MELTALLRKIEACPQLYVGDAGIPGLRHFLCGYILSEKERDPGYQDWLFSDFTAFLAEKYRDGRGLDFALLIAANEADGASTDTFFRLLREFADAAEPGREKR